MVEEVFFNRSIQAARSFTVKTSESFYLSAAVTDFAVMYVCRTVGLCFLFAIQIGLCLSTKLTYLLLQ